MWSLGAPWLSDRYVAQALDLWPTDSELAFDKLDRAAELNGLSPDPDFAAGSIALRLDRNDEAIDRFRAAVEREPRDSSSHLELGAVLFNEGDRAEGLRHLRRARKLDPRDEIIRGTLRRAQRGRRIDIEAMNRAIATRYRELGDSG
jgi:tetratricopeptide (TPR) repeat protein